MSRRAIHWLNLPDSWQNMLKNDTTILISAGYIPERIVYAATAY